MRNNAEDAAEDAEETDEGFKGMTLVDAKNGFNELSRYAMLWTVRHKWAKVSRFAMNCYRHFSRFVMRQPGSEPVFLSEEGVTQGDPFAGILYGIGLLPLAECLRAADPSTLQPFYADDLMLFSKALKSVKLLKILVAKGPYVGYYPDPDKSWHVCPKGEEESAKRIFADAGMNVKCCQGQRYLGGFVGSDATKEKWLYPMVDRWVHGVGALADVAGQYSQTAYAGMAQCLQVEWQYLSRCVPGVEKYLEPVEKAIHERFIPALFRVDKLDDDFRCLLANGAKQAGIGIRNPVESAVALHESSLEATKVLVENLLDNGVLYHTAHKYAVRKAGKEAREGRIENEKIGVIQLGRRKGRRIKKQLDRQLHTGAWLSAHPNRFDGTELCRDEFYDNLTLRYGNRPKGLPSHCDGCSNGFTVEHGLSCKKGVLVGQRNNDVRDELAHLCTLSLNESRVKTEPEIVYRSDSRASQPREDCHCTGKGRNGKTICKCLGDEARGDVAAHGFWKSGRTTIFDVRVTGTDAMSYGNTASEKILESAAKQKRSKYEEACTKRRRDFNPIFYSVDGMP